MTMAEDDGAFNICFLKSKQDEELMINLSRSQNQ